MDQKTHKLFSIGFCFFSNSKIWLIYENFTETRKNEKFQIPIEQIHGIVRIILSVWYKTRIPNWTVVAIIATAIGHISHLSGAYIEYAVCVYVKNFITHIIRVYFPIHRQHRIRNRKRESAPPTFFSSYSIYTHSEKYWAHTERTVCVIHTVLYVDKMCVYGIRMCSLSYKFFFFFYFSFVFSFFVHSLLHLMLCFG